MKKKHTIDIKPDANELSFMLDKSYTRRELFAIAEHIGASKKGDKWTTAKNVGRRLAEPELKTKITLTYYA